MCRCCSALLCDGSLRRTRGISAKKNNENLFPASYFPVGLHGRRALIAERRGAQNRHPCRGIHVYGSRFRLFNHKFKYGRAESWTAMLAFGCVLLILGILSFLHSVALTRRDVRRQAARAAKASRGILHPSASRLLLEFGVTSWMYAGLISLMVVGLLASQSGALGFSVYDSLRRSEWSSATWTTSILHFEMRLFLRPRSSSYAFVQTLAATPLTFMAFYVRFIGALINMCTIAVGPTIIVACLYPSCRVTCVYLLPQLALLCTAWVAFRSIVLTESASNPWWYNPIVNENHPLAVQIPSTATTTRRRRRPRRDQLPRLLHLDLFLRRGRRRSRGVALPRSARYPADGDGRERSHRCAAVAAGATRSWCRTCASGAGTFCTSSSSARVNRGASGTTALARSGTRATSLRASSCASSLST